HVRKLGGIGGRHDHTDAELLQDFLTRRDGGAFAALLARHGPLVWGVCRRILRHEQDAEDAFQAAFLVLARRAASIRRAEALPSWLHGVAARIAWNAQRTAARHHTLPPPAARPMPEPVMQAGLRELQGLVDAEVQRLPRKYRVAFVLCGLEGKS